MPERLMMNRITILTSDVHYITVREGEIGANFPMEAPPDQMLKARGLQIAAHEPREPCSCEVLV